MATSESRRNPAAAVLIRPFQEFFQLESASGILLLLMAILALTWANSPFAAAYFGLWDTTVTVDVGALAISKPLLLWINDGLMAVFFFVVGLEIKREVLVGELSDPKQAALAVAAAMGGMLVPAGIYALLNAGGEGAAGWGIPIAGLAFTDAALLDRAKVGILAGWLVSGLVGALVLRSGASPAGTAAEPRAVTEGALR